MIFIYKSSRVKERHISWDHCPQDGAVGYFGKLLSLVDAHVTIFGFCGSYDVP